MKKLILSFLFLFVMVSFSIAETINLKATWNLSTEPDISLYKLYRTDGVRILIGGVNHPNNSIEFSVVVPDGTAGTLTFIITAIDNAGQESPDSPPGSYSYNFIPPDLPPAAPSVPIILLSSVAYADKTMTYSVSHNFNDTYASSTESYALLTSMRIPYNADSQRAFIRWSVKIPKNATITSAKVRLNSNGGTAGGQVVNVGLLDYDSCPSLYSPNPYAYSITADPEIPWTISATSANAWEETDDISDLVTSYIGRAGYDYVDYIGLRFKWISGGLALWWSHDYGSLMPQLVVTYTGGDAILELFMADPYVRTKQYVYPQIYNQDAGDVLYAYLDDVLKHSYTILVGDVPADAGTAFEKSFLLDYTSLSAGEHHIDVVLKTSGGVTRATATKTWTTLHNGYPTVGINENNSLCIKNGGSCDLFFPITDFTTDYAKVIGPPAKYIVEPTNAAWQNGYKSGSSPELHKEFLDQGATINRKYIIGYAGTSKRAPDWGWLITNSSNCSTPASLDDCSIVNYLKNHSDLLAYTWFDEPNLGGDTTYSRATENDPPNYGLQETQRALRAGDTNHPISQMIMGINNDFLSVSSGYGRIVEYGYETNLARPVIVDIWNFDYYPYEYRHTTFSPSLENLCLSIDHSYSFNHGIYPIWVTLDPTDLHDTYGSLVSFGSGANKWVGSTAFSQDFQIVQNKSTGAACSEAEEAAGSCWQLRQTEASCTSDSSIPTWPSTIGNTVSDNTCTWINEGTHRYTGKAINIASWDSGTFQVGERVCKYSGGSDYCNDAGAFIGWPQGGQTSVSYIRKPAGLDNYQYNQLVFSSYDGTFTTGMQIRGQTSGALATFPGSNLWYRETGQKSNKNYDWTPPPTPGQLNNMVWLSIIHGARGLTWFSYFMDPPSDSLAQLNTIETDITSLKDVILQPISTKAEKVTDALYSAATVADARVDYTVRELGGTIYVLAARLKRTTDTPNPWPDPTNTNSVSAQIDIAGIASGQTINVYGESRSISANNGYFNDNFNDYDVHIYTISTSFTPFYGITSGGATFR